MWTSRRGWLAGFASVAGVFAAETVLHAQHTPQPIPSPNAPNQNFPPGLNGPDNRPDTSNKHLDPRTQDEIKADVEKLFSLASELKDEVEKSNANAMLSLPVLKAAQQIEKLAKQIKNLSKG